MMEEGVYKKMRSRGKTVPGCCSGEMFAKIQFCQLPSLVGIKDSKLPANNDGTVAATGRGAGSKVK